MRNIRTIIQVHKIRLSMSYYQLLFAWQVSASDDEDVSSKKHLGAGLKESSNPGLKKIMTEGDLFLYELAEKSEILKDDEAVQIGKILPPRAIGISVYLYLSSFSLLLMYLILCILGCLFIYITL